MSRFAELKASLMKKGLPESEAGGIAYKQGVKKLGKKEFERRAKRGREKALNNEKK